MHVQDARRNTSWYACDTRALFAKLLTPTTTTKRSVIRWHIAQVNGLCQDKLATREELAERLWFFADDDGTVAVEVWSRDCDCVEGTELYRIPASVMAYEQFANRMYDNAEGSMSLTILTSEQAESFKAYQRDRILEAFEEGETYYV